MLKAVTWPGNSFKTSGMSCTIVTREDSCSLDSSRLNGIIFLTYQLSRNRYATTSYPGSSPVLDNVMRRAAIVKIVEMKKVGFYGYNFMPFSSLIVLKLRSL